MTPSKMGHKGGKATAEKLTPEERRERASKGGSASWADLTPKQRRERALRGKATREARAVAPQVKRVLGESFDPEEHRYPGGNMPDLQTFALLACDKPPAGFLALPLKKRSEPRAGTNNARVLETLRNLAIMGPASTVQIARGTGLDRDLTINALSSLRSGGHIESVELAGSKREKLWRVK